MHKCINNSIGNVYHLEQFVDDFFPYSQKQLGFDKPATIRFESDQDNAGVMLGKTAYYDPEAMEVVLYTDGRHPKDVMRSLSHELVHHAQNCRGDFTGQNSTGAGYAQKDPHLRKMEREAYTKGNLIFRDFEDLIKTGKINIEIDFSDSGEPAMSLKEWKNNEINTKLMKKWGFLNESQEVTTDNTEELEEGHVHDDKCGCPDMEEGMQYRNDDYKGVGSKEHDDMEGDQFGMGDPLKKDKLEEDSDSAADEVDEAKRHVVGGNPDLADFIMPNKPKGKSPAPGQRVWDPRHLQSKTTKVPPVAVPGDDEPDTRTRHLNRTKGGKLGPAVRDPEHPDAIKRENKKISVREAKQITRRIIERIRKEGK